MMANIRVLPEQTAAEMLWDKVTKLAGLDLPSLWPQSGRDAEPGRGAGRRDLPPRRDEGRRSTHGAVSGA